MACRFAESCHFPGRCLRNEETGLQGVLAHLRVSPWSLSWPSNLTLCLPRGLCLGLRLCPRAGFLPGLKCC